MADVATQLSTTSHGGTFTATGITTVNGQMVLTVGDVFTCPTHAAQTVATGSTKTKDLNGKYMSFVGCLTSCGASILTGDPKLQLTG